MLIVSERQSFAQNDIAVEDTLFDDSFLTKEYEEYDYEDSDYVEEIGVLDYDLQKGAHYQIEERYIDTAAINSYRNDAAFNYIEALKPFETDSFWQMLKHRILHYIGKLFSIKGVSDVWQLLIYLLAFLIVIYGISKMFGMNFTNLFYNKKAVRSEVDYETIDENIHEIDFAKLIEASIAEGSYRKAVRLYYLKTLKRLSDKEIIDWQKNKTNADYRYEIEQSEHANDFSEITTIFDYIWYGEFPVDRNLFAQTENKFKQFISSI